MTFTAVVAVMLKPGIADVQGRTVERALPALGYDAASNVRVGKRIELDVEAGDADEARRIVADMCEKLLANPVIETYEVTIP